MVLAAAQQPHCGDFIPEELAARLGAFPAEPA
jgi:hypothetical protein